MRWNLIHDKSKDGINAHLFPLTSKDQLNYAFRMIGRERLNGRDVFHIAFRPKDKDDFGWSGDAYIDTTAFQPVLVTTGMARKIPFAVRTFLGTNVPGLGFTITYAPQLDGVWFPVNLSTEFKIHVLYFFHREIILDAQNRDFEKTHVTSRIVGEATPVDPNQPRNCFAASRRAALQKGPAQEQGLRSFVFECSVLMLFLRRGQLGFGFCNHVQRLGVRLFAVAGFVPLLLAALELLLARGTSISSGLSASLARIVTRSGSTSTNPQLTL